MFPENELKKGKIRASNSLDTFPLPAPTSRIENIAENTLISEGEVNCVNLKHYQWLAELCPYSSTRSV